MVTAGSLYFNAACMRHASNNLTINYIFADNCIYLFTKNSIYLSIIVYNYIFTIYLPIIAIV